LNAPGLLRREAAIAVSHRIAQRLEQEVAGPSLWTPEHRYHDQPEYDSGLDDFLKLVFAHQFGLTSNVSALNVLMDWEPTDPLGEESMDIEGKRYMRYRVQPGSVDAADLANIFEDFQAGDQIFIVSYGDRPLALLRESAAHPRDPPVPLLHDSASFTAAWNAYQAALFSRETTPRGITPRSVSAQSHQQAAIEWVVEQAERAGVQNDRNDRLGRLRGILAQVQDSQVTRSEAVRAIVIMLETKGGLVIPLSDQQGRALDAEAVYRLAWDWVATVTSEPSELVKMPFSSTLVPAAVRRQVLPADDLVQSRGRSFSELLAEAAVRFAISQ
jgi:hypothetical protein